MPSNIGQTKHVFCVDDDAQAIDLIGLALMDMQHIKLHKFTDAYTALEAMQRLKPDLVLLDVMMPDLNGVSAYNRIQESDELKGIKVVFVTGRKRDVDMQQYKGLGVFVIKKPLIIADIQNTVKSIL